MPRASTRPIVLITAAGGLLGTAAGLAAGVGLNFVDFDKHLSAEGVRAAKQELAALLGGSHAAAGATPRSRRGSTRKRKGTTSTRTRLASRSQARSSEAADRLEFAGRVREDEAGRLTVSP